MKKFTSVIHNITTSSANTNETIGDSISIIGKKVKKLIESLHIDVEGVETPWVNNVVISESAEFRIQLNELLNIMFFEQKKELFEQVHAAIVNRDVQFISEQLEALSESKKNN